MLTEQQKKYHCREVNSGLGVNREKDIKRGNEWFGEDLIGSVGEVSCLGLKRTCRMNGYSPTPWPRPSL